MARTALTVNTLTRDASLVQPAGNAVDPANGHVLAAEGVDQATFLDIDSTFAGAKTFTIKAGAFSTQPNADLVISLNAQRALIGPLSSGKYAQADGTINIDVAAAATGTIRAYRIPNAS
jgi:hypothetical protein